MKTLLVLLIVGYMAVYSHAQCSMGTSDTWADQPYQTDSASLNDPNGTPVGFDTIDFPGVDETNYRAPCVQVNFPAAASDPNSRYIYILAESLPGRICIGLEGEDETSCGTGRLHLCRENVATSLRVEFSCDASCAQNEFLFYYRVVTEYREVDDEDFCDNVNMTYPTDLRATPSLPTFDPNPESDPPSGAIIVSSLLLQAILLVSLLAVLFM